MGFLEVFLLGIALAMDACAVAMICGMTEKGIRVKRALLIGGFFGFFQFLMPLIGYFITGLIANAFLDVFEKVSAWVSFGLLVFLGGKMLFESVCELMDKRRNGGVCKTGEKLTLGKLTLQAVATSIDALAVGVPLQSAALSAQGLFLGVWGSTLIIGGVTFLLGVAAVYIGKAIGCKLADKAGLLGGVVLIGIGIKLLIEGLM